MLLKAREPVSALTHFVGMILTVVGLVMLIMESVSKRRSPQLGLNSNIKGSFTHEIAGPFETVYYLGGPQQARPPEGKFRPGTRVRLIRNAGSYSVVQSETGITPHVSTGALKPI